MANQDQDIVDLHSARVAKLYHWMYILHAQTRKNIMHLESLQSITQPLTKWFTDLITKPFFPSRRYCQIQGDRDWGSKFVGEYQ